MKKNINQANLVIMLIMVQTIAFTSCSSPEFNNPLDPKSDNYTGSLNQYPGGSISYGGQTYKTVSVAAQTWMAENLNYNASGFFCAMVCRYCIKQVFLLKIQG